MVEHTAVPEGLIAQTRYVWDRGERPTGRGVAHFIGAILSVIAGTVLSTYAWMTLPWWQALGVSVYAVGLFALFGVSAAYHRGPWRREKTVVWWRRADHAMIAVFIAATYTPLSLIALSPVQAAWMLGVVWAGALLGVALSLVWIEHPRWVDLLVYLALGWMIVPLIPQLWAQTSPAVVWLLFAGGLVYSLGAVMYAVQWPGRSARHYGFHEHFHTATVIAAVLHLVAVWIVVVG
ncbi:MULTISPECIES: PAQR family membrane homeostasis protein TrhA [unclassified Corynebacterium]|uniref:PAQR family membrane homeostasis protein TrhA n=1 Tax=unclassified Corynebacterium TaxID=2624378 RepID=UPI0029CAA07D|nr:MULTISPECIES: hemolysin III family protein [unclassified Corynebacterium]WPF65763.1 hemolysin III family protein [Corynebacterium sp. 22KM0430]WPF68257.1 hemolysin III family protein [Corynebacterium sp. 21KM1197]